MDEDGVGVADGDGVGVGEGSVVSHVTQNTLCFMFCSFRPCHSSL